RAEARHVLAGAVGEGGGHSKPVGLARGEGMPRGPHFQPGDPRALSGVEWRPGGDPAAEDLVLGAARRRAPPAGVGELASRLREQEAGLGREEVQAPPGGAAEEAFVIEDGVGAEERQREAVLPLDGAVAGAAVAAQPAENRLDVAGEARRGFRVAARA